jgi:hypothetical protein
MVPDSSIMLYQGKGIDNTVFTDTGTCVNHRTMENHRACSGERMCRKHRMGRADQGQYAAGMPDPLVSPHPWFRASHMPNGDSKPNTGCNQLFQHGLGSIDLVMQYGFPYLLRKIKDVGNVIQTRRLNDIYRGTAMSAASCQRKFNFRHSG